MPVLELEEIGVETAKKRVDLPEDEKRPVICVFDPIRIHVLILGFVLGEFLDQTEIFWQSQFSRTFIETAGISKDVYPGLIAMKKPILLVSELETIPGEYPYGIEMLQNIRRTVGLKNTPLVIISNEDCLARAKAESGSELEELKIDGIFTWNDLQRKPGEQQRLFNIVLQILGPKPDQQRVAARTPHIVSS